MDIRNKFIDLNFLKENVIKENRQILKNTFNIDISELINNIESIYVENKNIGDKINIIFERIHRISISGLGIYNINIEEYFNRNSSIGHDYKEESKFKNFIEEYIFENFILNMHLAKFYNEDKKEKISQINSIKKYILSGSDDIKKFYFSYEPDGGIKDIIERQKEYSKKISMNLKQLRRNSNKYEQLNNIFIDTSDETGKEKKCYSIISNVFIEMMDNIFKSGYINTRERVMNQKKVKYTHHVLIKRMKDFFNRNISVEEYYFWERINNTMFIQDLYVNVKESIDGFREQQDLFEYLFPTIYLPNVFLNESFLRNLIVIYMNGNTYYKFKGEYEERINNLCLNLAFLLIPLYNMIFSNILYEFSRLSNVKLINIIESYIDKNKEKISEINKYINKKSDHDYIKKRLDDSIKKLSYVDSSDNKKFDEAEFLLLSLNVCDRINFNIFDLNNIVKYIGAFNEDFLNITSNCLKYKLVLKEFIFKILFENPI